MSHSLNVIVKIAIAAILIRWGYALALFCWMGIQGLMGPDSTGYISLATSYANSIATGTVHGWQWLGPTPHLMPLFSWTISLCFLIFGPAAGPVAYVLLQGLFDAGTCVLIFGTAAAFASRFAVPAAIAAVVNPTQIVFSGLVYTDTIFVFFCALFLYGSVRWLQTPSMRWGAIIGVGLGAAALTRPMVVPWIAVLLAFLLIAGCRAKALRLARAKTLILAGVLAALCVAPVLARNVAVYGAWSVTAQSGMHLAFWVVPLVREARDATPLTAGAEEIRKRTEDRFGGVPQNPFEESRRYAIVGREALAELGLGAIVKAWLVGSAINLGAPALIIAPPVFALPRTGFFATAGRSSIEKIANFLFRSDNSFYAWILLTGIAGVVVWRISQAIGLSIVMPDGAAWPAIALFGLWIAYVLAINGPVASPKYRLPIEPPLMVLTGATLAALHVRWRSRGGRDADT